MGKSKGCNAPGMNRSEVVMDMVMRPAGINGGCGEVASGRLGRGERPWAEVKLPSNLCR